MKAFSGNCEQVLLLEQLIANSDNCILMDKNIEGARLFEVQKDFESQVIVMRYTFIVKGGFLPKEHPISFRYNRAKNYAEVNTTRVLADILLNKRPEMSAMAVSQNGSNGG
jgi:hypothetical protein